MMLNILLPSAVSHYWRKPSGSTFKHCPKHPSARKSEFWYVQGEQLPTSTKKVIFFLFFLPQFTAQKVMEVYLLTVSLLKMGQGLHFPWSSDISYSSKISSAHYYSLSNIADWFCFCCFRNPSKRGDSWRRPEVLVPSRVKVFGKGRHMLTTEGSARL